MPIPLSILIDFLILSSITMIYLIKVNSNWLWLPYSNWLLSSHIRKRSSDSMLVMVTCKITILLMPWLLIIMYHFVHHSSHFFFACPIPPLSHPSKKRQILWCKSKLYIFRLCLLFYVNFWHSIKLFAALQKEIWNGMGKIRVGEGLGVYNLGLGVFDWTHWALKL